MAQDDKLDISFEFFPPHSEKMEENLWRSIKRLEPLAPRFVSVTYGADGSTRERTHRVVTQLAEQTQLVPAAHLTCVGAEREDIDEVARGYWRDGIRHIVALRGDPPGGDGVYQGHPGGYAHAVDLVAGLTRVADFDITVAAYPEVHPEAPSAGFDLDVLRHKIDAGAKRAITQFFFDPEVFLRFRDRCVNAGIEASVVPGILPVTNFARVIEFAGRCGATVPDSLKQRFEGLDEDPQTRKLIAATTAIELVQTLRREGVTQFHFYTLNRHDLTYAICHDLGVRAAANRKPVAPDPAVTT